MTDLNVTEGDWVVTKYGYEKYSINGENGKEVASVWFGDNAYLIAQAKNMYEMLGELLKNEECDVFEMSSEIQELLNACRPPEE